MIRSGWLEKLEFAANASLTELIVPADTVTGFLRGDLGLITPADLDALADIGLPKIQSCVYPAIMPDAVERGADRVFKLGSYDPDLSLPTGEQDPEGPKHLFVAEPATGRVVKVSREIGLYRVAVNVSIRHFVEMAWRYYHIKPVLYEMQYSGDDDIPFSEEDEENAIKEHAWVTVARVDPSFSGDSESFWWGAIWDYL